MTEQLLALLIGAELCGAVLLALRMGLRHLAEARPQDDRLTALEARLKAAEGTLAETRRMVDDDRTRRALGTLK